MTIFISINGQHFVLSWVSNSCTRSGHGQWPLLQAYIICNTSLNFALKKRQNAPLTRNHSWGARWNEMVAFCWTGGPVEHTCMSRRTLKSTTVCKNLYNFSRYKQDMFKSKTSPFPPKQNLTPFLVLEMDKTKGGEQYWHAELNSNFQNVPVRTRAQNVANLIELLGEKPNHDQVEQRSQWALTGLNWNPAGALINVAQCRALTQ